ncbi:MAG: hypothetical protein V4591_09915 [Bdellovibrionota bacterium]
MNVGPVEHKKILIDNSVCKRRFHLVYENNPAVQEHVVVKCPHCSVTLFEQDSHSPVTLAREENLVYAPTGDAQILSTCNFLKQHD